MVLHKTYLLVMTKILTDTGIEISTAERMVKVMDEEHSKCVDEALTKNLS